MNFPILKYLRRGTAAIFGGMILVLFLDFAGIVPQWFHALAHIQLIPALLGGMFVAAGLILLSALLFGRLYCSVLCPLGILQDFIFRLKKWVYTLTGRKKKLKGHYEKPHNILRYGILGLTVISFIFGSSYLILLLDPYSNFGRIVTALFKPAAVWLNNLLASILGNFDIYSVYQVELYYLTPFLISFAAVILVALTAMVWAKERLWCNTLCPVGTLLGLFSRYSLFRITFDKSQCVHCKSCSGVCKSRCIDDDNCTTDMSRCVVCFNCLDRCKKHGLKYSPVVWGRQTAATPKLSAQPCAVVAPKPSATVLATATEKSETSKEGLTPQQLSRRRFIEGSALTLAALPLASLAQRGNKEGENTRKHDSNDPLYKERQRYPLPPGAVFNFKDVCTGCQLCVTKCPMQTLRPAFLEHGLTAMMQPLMYFQPHCYCNYDCTICSDICPAGALQKLTVEEKKLTQTGIVHFIRQECIVHSEHQDCGACAEHCPTQAVHMVPYEDGLTIPAIRPEICIGCGACESICPVRPKAIFIEGNDEQVRLEPEIEIRHETDIEESNSASGSADVSVEENADTTSGATAKIQVDSAAREEPEEIGFGF